MRAVSEIRRLGWETLVKELGVKDATRFIMEYERGYGDYTQIRKEIFNNKDLDEIVQGIKKMEK